MKVIYQAIWVFCALVGPLAGAESMPEYDFIGRHFFASYYGCNSERLNDLAGMSQHLKEAATKSGATVLAEAKYQFDPQGISIILLLSESHASVHTYPEHQACFVDLFTCGTQCNAEKFDEALRDYLLPERCSGQTLMRE